MKSKEEQALDWQVAFTLGTVLVLIPYGLSFLLHIPLLWLFAVCVTWDCLRIVWLGFKWYRSL